MIPEGYRGVSHQSPTPHQTGAPHDPQQGRRGNLSATGPLNPVKALSQRLPAIPIPPVVTIPPIPITVMVAVPIPVPIAAKSLLPLPGLMALPGLMLSPRLLPRIRLLRRKSALPAKLLIPLPSIVVTRIVIAIAWRTELNAYSKLLCLRLRRSRQRNRARYQTNRYTLHYHRLYAREFHNNLLLTSH